eukprot:362156-Chlamydomonas_euryale.AAC.2
MSLNPPPPGIYAHPAGTRPAPPGLLPLSASPPAPPRRSAFPRARCPRPLPPRSAPAAPCPAFGCSARIAWSVSPCCPAHQTAPGGGSTAGVLWAM